MTKHDLKKHAVKLRQQGYSYNLILQEVPVAKSTLSTWLADIPHTPNKHVKNRIRGAALKTQEWQQNRKNRSFAQAREEAQEAVGAISNRDLFMLGIGLYIGEGTKTMDHVRIVNSEPEVICLAIRWFEECLDLKRENFSLTIHLYPDNNAEEALSFWSRVTDVPRTQFGKTQIDVRKKKVKKQGMLKYGTAHLCVRSNGEARFGVFLSRKILALMQEVYHQGKR